MGADNLDYKTSIRFSQSHGQMYIAVLIVVALALLALVVFGWGGDDEETYSDGGSSGYRIDERSPNGQYRVRTESDGSVVLTHAEDGVRWEKDLQRPNGVSVSNDGTVTVENWDSSDPELISEFVAFDREGDKLVEEGYDALVRDSGVDLDGSIAWVATAGDAASTEDGDGNQLFVYDLEKKSRLLETDPPVMEIERVEKSEETVDVIADGLRCRYQDGEMIDPEGFQWAKEERRLEAASTPNKVAGVVKERLDRADQLSDDQLRSTLGAVRNFDGSGTDRMWAKLWRRKGELHHYLGETEQAQQHYEKARSLDEEIDVEDQLRQLQEDAVEK